MPLTALLPRAVASCRYLVLVLHSVFHSSTHRGDVMHERNAVFGWRSVLMGSSSSEAIFKRSVVQRARFIVHLNWVCIFLGFHRWWRSSTCWRMDILDCSRFGVARSLGLWCSYGRKDRATAPYCVRPMSLPQLGSSGGCSTYLSSAWIHRRSYPSKCVYPSPVDRRHL